MKKKFLIITIIFILVLVFIFLINTNTEKKVDKKIGENGNDSGVTYDVYNIIQDNINSEKELLVYFTNSDSDKCFRCKSIDKLITNFEKKYNLKILIYDTDNELELKKLNNQFDFPKGYISNPSFLVIKDGSAKGCVSDVVSESQIKDLLIEFGFIDEKYKNIEIELTKENFEEYFKKENNSLILINKGDKFKNMITELSLKYKFQYGIIYINNMNYYSSYISIAESIGNELDSGGLVIVNSNKVIDYTASDKEDEIIEFLKKNKIIN